MLRVYELTKYFGGLTAVRNVTFEIHEKEIVGLIGPNGAGKTTIFNLISGFYKPNKGKIIFNEKDITNFTPYKICKEGIGRTFQIPKPFLNMSCLQNVIIGALFGKDEHKDFNKAKREAIEIIDFIGLSKKVNMLAKNLTLVDRKKLEIARALATNPKLLLLDEVAAGLNPVETEEVMELMKKIRNQGITLFIVEHVMKVIMGIAERIIVLHHGEKIAEGKPHEIVKNEKVIEAYLGEGVEIA
ncbi:MAG: ABC transporter ATP-binding protein [Nitrososphaerota archaeon]